MVRSSASRSEPSSPLEHLDTLYPLACLLVGSEAAPPLLVRMVEKATADPAEGPEDLDEWLHALFRTALDEGPSSHSEITSTSEDESGSPDPLRRDAAEQIVEETLPLALAACPPRQRFLLALEGLEQPPDDGHASRLRDALDTTPSEARASLRATFKDFLSEGKFGLVEETLSDEFLREALDDLLADRFSTIPASLRTHLQSTLQTIETAEDNSTHTQGLSFLLERLPAGPTSRSLLFVLLIGAMVLAGGTGLWYFLQPSASSSPSMSSQSLVAFSAQYADSVVPDVKTSRSAVAETFVDSTWNRRVAVPSFEGAGLQGVGRVHTDGDIDVPVYLYTTDTDTIATFAYNYALVNQLGDEVTLSTELRTALAEDQRRAAEEDAGEGLLWRDRDDIFVAVSPSLPADSLRTRLRP